MQELKERSCKVVIKPNVKQTKYFKLSKQTVETHLTIKKEIDKQNKAR